MNTAIFKNKLLRSRYNNEKLMLLPIISYIPSAIGLLIIGMITYLKNSRSRVNSLFFFLTITIATWLIILFVSDLLLSDQVSLFALRAAACIGMLMAPLILYFSIYFPIKLKNTSPIFHFFALVPTAFFMIMALTPFLIPSIEIRDTTPQPTNLNILYTFQTIYLIASFALSFIIMIRKYRSISARERSQIKLVVFGLIVGLFVNVITGFILATLNTANRYSNLTGSLSLLVFISATSYAVVKHRMFDVRMAITRIIGYTVTLGIIVLVYTLFILAISAQLSGLDGLSGAELIAIILPTIFIALTFHRLKTAVAQATRRVFYQDSYDLKQTLDNLSDALLTDNNIGALMSQSLDIIDRAIKPAHTYFVILHDADRVYREIMIGRDSPPDVDWYIEHVPKHTGRIIAKDEIESGAWKNHLDKEEVSLVLRLGTKSNLIGLLMFGPKQNGSVYTKQDIELLQICAKNLGIALDNARKYEQISAFADTLHEEVTLATTSLRRANEELKSLDSLKDDFMSMASHQLRTPATSVHQALQMLSNPKLSDKDRGELIQMAEASSERLVTVVMNMLNMSRLQAGRFTIDRSSVVMQDIVNKVVSQTKVLADQKNIALKTELSKQPITTVIDVAKMNEAMSNYIENAIKYSQEGTTVTISLKHDGDHVLFEVSDTGMGVPVDERKKLFGKFYRAKNARLEQPDGNGIGLYVVRSIAQGHKGDAYYEPLPHGSLFGLWFPLSANK